MTLDEQKNAAIEFVNEWRGRGNEIQDTQSFWEGLLRDVFGVAKPEKYINREKYVYINGTQKKIDVYIESTRVLIEQKSYGIPLLETERQSDGVYLTPFEQAQRYNGYLRKNEFSDYIITCNFAQFNIYDMSETHKKSEPTYSFYLEELPKEFPKLQFLVKEEDDHNIKFVHEEQLSEDAGDLVGKLYDALLKQYDNPDDPESSKSLNALCVRLVFCLYAEDAGLFDTYSAFHDYLDSFNTAHMQMGLAQLFTILNTKDEDRSPNIEEQLKRFPYVNGGLFKDDYEIPQFSDEIRHILLDEMSSGFNWSEISPTIFGAVFESTLNPDTRHKGGMHYTSVENIHKIIDSLFLDDLKQELEDILRRYKSLEARKPRLEAFTDKLATLKFLDPACGSGNFLTETYISLRELENTALFAIFHTNEAQIGLKFTDMDEELKTPIKVSINQFYGIEVNDFAVTVAKTALWIAESQMLKKTQAIIVKKLNFLPLRTSAKIIKEDALKYDWNDVIPAKDLNYIMGNPPFLGASEMDKNQKKEAVDIFGKIKLSNSIDYVGAWYHLAAKYIYGTNIRVAFVSTNSITQGEQVKPLWDTVLNKYNCSIYFAYRTFIWDSKAKNKAHVHCVIIGIAYNYHGKKYINTGDSWIEAKNINPYLKDDINILVESTSVPLCNVPTMTLGNKPSDGGNLILSEEEKAEILKKEPGLGKYIHEYIGATEYINGKKRYCLWLTDATPDVIHGSKELYKRALAVKEMRENSTAKPTREKASTPHLFFFISQPTTDYLIVPSSSSQNRDYIPIGFLSPDIIANNSTTIIAGASLYHFGVLESRVHMAWMRTIGGRLKSDYRYSTGVVYNTFPWPTPTDAQKAKIEQTAKSILDARALNPNTKLAVLYDRVTMPDKLEKAHKNNDLAVLQAYGFPADIQEDDIVKNLTRLYQDLYLTR